MNRAKVRSTALRSNIPGTILSSEIKSGCVVRTKSRILFSRVGVVTNWTSVLSFKILGNREYNS